VASPIETATREVGVCGEWRRAVGPLASLRVGALPFAKSAKGRAPGFVAVIVSRPRTH